jgi:hypothetical protein
MKVIFILATNLKVEITKLMNIIRKHLTGIVNIQSDKKLNAGQDQDLVHETIRITRVG